MSCKISYNRFNNHLKQYEKSLKKDCPVKVSYVMRDAISATTGVVLDLDAIESSQRFSEIQQLLSVESGIQKTEWIGPNMYMRFN